MRLWTIAILFAVTACTAQEGASTVPEDAEPTLIDTLSQIPSGLVQLGQRNASLTLTIFTNHHCRYCQEFHREQLPELVSAFVEPGDLHIVIGILPLRKYLGSDLAAKAIICSLRQGRGMEMHDALFVGQSKTTDILLQEAAELELDLMLFEACLESPRTEHVYDDHNAWMQELEISQVPIFFLEGERLVGLQYIDDLKAKIESALRDL